MIEQTTGPRPFPELPPSLRGWGLRAYNILWSALLLAALAMTAVGAWKGFTPMQYGWLNYGLSASADARQIMLVTGAEATAKGISAGDRIVAIDGAPPERIDTSWAAIQRRLAKPEGTTLALTLRDAAGRVVTHRLTSSAANTAPVERTRGLAAAAALLTQLALLSAAILLFRRRRELVPALLAVSFTLIAALASSDATLWLDQRLLQRLFNVAGFGLLLLGLLLFPDGRLRSGASRLIALCIAGWGIALLWLPYTVADQVFALGLALLMVAVGIRQALHYRKMPPGNQRQQVRWAIFGFTCGILFFASSLVLYIAAMQLGGADFEPLTVASTVAYLLGTLCIVGGLLVSLMRYRLYDADAVIGRSAAYGVLTLGFVAVFAAGEEVIEKLGQSYFGGDAGALAGALAAALAAVLIVPLHRRVNEWAELRFQKQLLRLRRGLPEIVGDLRETASVDRISDAVATAVLSGVQATRAAVLVDGEVTGARSVSAETARAWLEDRDIAAEEEGSARRDPLFPMRLPLETDAIGRVGWLVLGPRPDGSFYGKDEREALNKIAGPVARAIEIARMRARRDKEMRARIEALENAVTALGGPALRAANAP